jgi:hypothetical protein
VNQYNTLLPVGLSKTRKSASILLRNTFHNYRNCQKYVPLDLANLSKVIASEAKQSLRFSKRLLRRKAPRNDRLSEQIFDSRYRLKTHQIDCTTINSTDHLEQN